MATYPFHDVSVNLETRKKRLMALASGIFIAYLALHFVFGRHELPAYDMYTYLSFAKHYADHWFHTVIPGQAHGLQILSYPPLLFQITALLISIPFVDPIAVYILLMSTGATAFSLSFYYLFTQFFDLDERYSWILILFIAFSPGLLKFVFVHGQLPLIIGSVFGFLSVALFHQVLQGRNRGGYLISALVLTAYVHHFSFLIMVLMMAIVSIINLEKVVSRIDYLAPLMLISTLLALVGLFPMIREMLFGVTQGQIFHGSRHPLSATDVFHQFLTSTYGIAILGLPLLFWKKRRSLTVNLTAMLFLTLGLGFVTPTPKILFGGFADFLVYDRFSLIASLFLSALLGLYVAELDIGKLEDIPVKKILIGAFIILGLGTAFWANKVHIGSYTGYRYYEPGQTGKTVSYLNQNASEDYLYMTHSHMPPVDEIRRGTDVPTLDTAHFQGRRIEWFGPWNRLDLLPKQDFMKIIRNAENVSLKYVFTYERSYTGDSASWMQQAGWNRTKLGEDTTVWINPDPVPKYRPDLGEKRLIFGTVPMVILVLVLLHLASPRLRDDVELLLERMQIHLNSLLSWMDGFVEGSDASQKIWIWCLALAVLAASPAFLTQGVFPSGIDTPAHIFKADLMGHMIERYGKMYRWTNWWYNGYPFMAIYPPAGNFLVYSVDTVFNSLKLSYNLVRLFALGATTAVVYLFSRKISDDWRVWTFSTTLAAFSYPIYSNLFTVGRLSSALALPLYFLLLFALTTDKLYCKSLNRHHFLLGVGAALLFLTHSLLAYLFIFTAGIYAGVYREKVRKIGVLPLLVTPAVAVILSLPYLSRLVQHSAILDPSWHVVPVAFIPLEQVWRSFNVIPPLYIGWIHAVFLVFGIARYWRIRDRFLKFSILNLVLLYALFWLRNFGIASKFVPLAGQFDLSRFEILFAVFGIFIATYGFRQLLEKDLSDIAPSKKTLFSIGIVLLVLLDTAPMIEQSSNWSPNFDAELSDVPLDDDYRAMGVGMRQWSSYILWNGRVKNVFGWFLQGDASLTFTKKLQSAGGRWHGWKFSPSIENEEFRKNLMQISNTKYILLTQGQWLPEKAIDQVKGEEPINHPLKEELRREISRDSEFEKIYSSEHLDAYRLEREMSYCERIEPVWIENRYWEEATEFFMQENPMPRFPVRGDPADAMSSTKSNNLSVSCSKPNPYTISIDAEGSGWVLVKESSYPYWNLESSGNIYEGYGFMVVHVDGNTTLNYNEQGISSLSLEEIQSFFSSFVT